MSAICTDTNRATATPTNRLIDPDDTVSAFRSGLAPQSPPRRYQGYHAEHGSADAEDDDDDVPQRPPVIQEREVETVQSLIQPSAQPGDLLVALHNRTTRWVDVQPRLLRVGVSHAQHRERT